MMHAITPYQALSSLQNCLPYSKDRIDLVQMDESGFEAADQLLDQLQNQLVHLEFKPSGSTIESFQHLYHATKTFEKLEGSKTLGLGFPLVAHFQLEELALTPILIWPLQLEPSINKVDQWKITSTTSSAPRLNPYALPFIKSHIPSEEITDLQTALEHGNYTQKALWSFVDKLLQSGKEPGVFENATYLSPLPDTQTLGDWATEEKVLFSGVLAAYPYALSHFDPHELDFEPSEQETDLHDFGFFQLNPNQTSIFQHTQKNSLTTVSQQPSETYQPAVLQLISNALSNGQKVLVTSDRLGNLEQLQKDLIQSKLDSYHYFIRDIAADLPILSDLLKAKSQNAKNKPLDKNRHKLLMGKCTRNKKKLDAAFQFLEKPLFGDLNWTELVGFFLRSNAIQGKELLASHLSPEDYEFSPEEFTNLKSILERSAPLYEKVNTLKHPLTNLHPSIFLESTQEASFHLLEREIEGSIQSAKALQLKYISAIDNFTLKLSDHYGKYYLQYQSRLNQILDSITDATNQFGAAFLEKTPGSLKVQGLFSAKAREMRTIKEKAASNYQSLASLVQKNKLIDFNFPGNLDARNISEIKKVLENFGTALKQWRGDQDRLIQESLIRLNKQNVQSELQMEDYLDRLDQELQDLLDQINSKNLYASPFKHQMLTVPKKQQYIEQTIEYLENTQRDLRDFEVFYPWQRNWLNLEPNAQKILKGLTRVQPVDWFTAFDSWYFHQYLNLHFEAQLPSDLETLESFVPELTELQGLLEIQTYNLWVEKAVQRVKKVKKKEKDIAQLLFGKTIPESNYKNVKLAYSEGLDAITDYFPVLVSSLSNALVHFNPKEPLFDYLVVYESQGIPSAVVPKLQDLAKHILIIGQSYPCSKTGLVEYLKDWGYPPLSISSPYTEIDQVPSAQSEFLLYQINGQYDEQKQQNDLEAQHILQVLNEIRETPHRTMPKVGILTFTEAQRNLISSYLLRIKQQQASGHQKIRQLERNGLRVLQMEEAYGLEFDILLLSFTFGSINTKSELTDHFQRISNDRYQAWISWLLFQKAQKVYILHSLPEIHPDLNQSALPIWQFLDYARANAEEDHARIHEIANIYALPASPEAPMKYFPKEIAQLLSTYFPKESIQVSTFWKNLYLPVFLKAEHSEEPSILIQPDLFFAHTPFTDYGWELAQRKELQEKEVHIEDIWSTQWWRNPIEESRKLASSILQFKGQFKRKSDEEE